MVGSGSRRRGAKQNGSLHKLVGAKSLRVTESGVVGALGSLPLGKREARAPAREDQRSHDSGGKKHKKSGFGGNREQVPQFSPPRNPQKILHSKKGSPGRTYKANTEATTKVNDLNQKTVRPFDTRASLYLKFAKVSKSLGEVVVLFDQGFVVTQDAMKSSKEAQRFAEVAAEQVDDRVDQKHRLPQDYESAEADLNEGLGGIRDFVRDTAAAAHALSCRTND